MAFSARLNDYELAIWGICIQEPVLRRHFGLAANNHIALAASATNTHPEFLILLVENCLVLLAVCTHDVTYHSVGSPSLVCQDHK